MDFYGDKCWEVNYPGWDVLDVSFGDKNVRVYFKNYYVVVFYWIPSFEHRSAKELLSNLQSHAKEVGFGFFYMRLRDNRQWTRAIIDRYFVEKLKKPRFNLSSEFTIAKNLNELERVSKNWRREIKKAQNNERISIRRNITHALFIPLIESTSQTKKISMLSSERILKLLQNMDGLKTWGVFLNGRCIAARAICHRGANSLDVLACSDKSEKNTYNHHLVFTALTDIKKAGATKFDFGGIDKERNSGTYFFKKGICGEENKICGEFEFSNFPFLNTLVNIWSGLRR